MRYFIICLSLLCSQFNFLHAQDNSEAMDIIERSIRFHDPEGQILSKSIKMSFEEKRPDGTVNESFFKCHVPLEKFDLERGPKDKRTRFVLNQDNIEIYRNDKKLVTEEDLEKYNLTNTRAKKLKDYYLYLWALPMKLRDPGTKVFPRVNTIQFNNEVCYEVKVEYDDAVGQDVWYFYFKTDNYQMIAYRFYHDESANDGEYIFLSEILEHNNMRIPAKRKWYTHKENKFLGEDQIIKIEVME